MTETPQSAASTAKSQPETRIGRRFAELRRSGELGLVAYITAGDPSLAATREIVLAAADAGADIIELGVPFSDPVADGPVMYRNPPSRFGEYGIGCECCHGPGVLHLGQLRHHPGAVSGNVNPTIVDPAKLPPRLADDICLKCHEGWAARVLQPGKTELDFRPGTPLYDTVALFKVPVTPDRRAELDRLETLPPVKGTISTPMWFKHSLMEMSKCYHDSNGKLRCITCHIIHDPPTEENKVAYYRERCFTCHNNQSCKLSVAERSRRQPANDCVGCHMPRKGVAGIPHSDDTNHRIVRSLHPPAG